MRWGIALLIALAGCSQPVVYRDVVVHDTVEAAPRVVDSSYKLTVKTVPKCDSVAMRLRAATFKLNRIRYYVGICNKNPKQDKFLKGWINRALK